MNPTQEQLAPTVEEVLARWPRSTEPEPDGIVFINMEVDREEINSALIFSTPSPFEGFGGSAVGHTVQCIPPQEYVEQWDPETRSYWLNGERL